MVSLVPQTSPVTSLDPQTLSADIHEWAGLDRLGASDDMSQAIPRGSTFS
jgi:hypothetical protein